ncbi:MAG TPA: FAD-dependent oxidoreductase, partial [Candidatus Pacearchaeota archaeon]|nr:FAD-dependent oxidoreductase [Candidatus Pacearchaeota archaeon]
AGFETALFLERYASEVVILEKGDKPLASPEIQEKAKKQGIKIIVRAEVKELRGKDFVESFAITMSAFLFKECLFRLAMLLMLLLPKI